jgi:hypothetical protein
MDWLIWSGAAVTLAGVAGLLWSILVTLRARRAGWTTPPCVRGCNAR